MFTNATTKKIKVGNTFLGGGSPVLIQSMLSVPSNDFAKNVDQAVRLQNAGCEIIRVSVPDKEAVGLISAIKEKISVPLVADIHFDYRLALDSVAAGVDKVRINPGNIGGDENVKAVARACNAKNIPIRIGVNSGSLEKEILKKYGSPTPEAMVESAEYHIALLNKFDFDNIVVSLKSSDTKRMYDAYSLLAEKYNYPLHLGVTEAGFGEDAIIKSSAAIGGLLLRGIGDTIRISLTDDPTEEVKAAKKLLNAIDLRNDGIRFVSCPTCGRTRINLIKLANDAKERFGNV
ncbi:MAG: flavodoxin-dependent (E)-4-hydroxy-3-methylbut-2-enyl-diphosphate synthase, partial [Clostridia bacterium]|nr:flavodoxin-dependent (E)-4-hydroxy-3-methylbut-2-enyl-diphosphate synthase [Clostridia bacterium]